MNRVQIFVCVVGSVILIANVFLTFRLGKMASRRDKIGKKLGPPGLYWFMIAAFLGASLLLIWRVCKL